jgi:hypothetical protein
MSKKWFLLFCIFFFLGLSKISHSLSPVLLRGVVVPGGVVCPLFRTESGDLVTLTGLSVKGFAPGTLMGLQGRWEAQSVCMQAYPTLRVEHISVKEPKR